MGNPIRVCLVGAGRVAQVHSNSLVHHVPEGKLVAVIDNNENVLYRLADQYDIKIGTFPLKMRSIRLTSKPLSSLRQLLPMLI